MGHQKSSIVFRIHGLIWILAASASAQDVVHLRNGVSLRGKVLSVANAEIRIKAMIVGSEHGEGYAMHRYLLNQVAFIDLEELPEVRSLLERRPSEKRRERLEQLAEERRVVLPLPNTNAGDIFLALIESLIESEGTGQTARILGLCEAVIQKDWSIERRERARRLRLRALIAGEWLEQALAEAEAIVEESEDPFTRVEAQLALGDATFKQLEAFVEDHPRWRDDEEWKGERNRLYHLALDRFLHPALFHGSLRIPASRGLWGAVRVYRFAGEWEKAEGCARELAKLYAATSAGSKAAQWLAWRKEQEDRKNETERQDTDG